MGKEYDNKQAAKDLEAINKVALKSMYHSRQPTVKQVQEAQAAYGRLKEYLEKNGWSAPDKLDFTPKPKLSYSKILREGH